jgi:hypothetical protein
MSLHRLNWYFGWGLLLSAFVTGAVVGLFFHREDFWGGYASFRRRLVRLGHISQAALGMLNVLYALAPAAADPGPEALASIGFVVGGAAMPLVCFLTAWKKPFRLLFVVPVTALAVAVLATLCRGVP